MQVSIQTTSKEDLKESLLEALYHFRMPITCKRCGALIDTTPLQGACAII
ncbi:MAG: hypothetical protein ACE5J9_02725 [Methanosarcinales archaeon]